ncbi:MAG: hypothetical protein ACKE5M_03265 [Methylophilaceae bacterium]
MLTLHISIICWDGKENCAELIASQVEGLTDYLTVIYSTKDGLIRSGTGAWIQVPDDWFYGKKFKKSLDLNKGDIHLQIQADAESKNWAQLVSRCKKVHLENKKIGIWAPEVNYTYWETEDVKISNYVDSTLIHVAQTDSTVWSFTKGICNKLHGLKYEKNNFGWGIDWAAITFAMSNDYLVLRDLSLEVSHIKGTGYHKMDSVMQMDMFLDQLTPQEKTMYELLINFIENNQKLNMEKCKSSLKKLLRF